MFRLQNIQVKLAARYAKVISFQRLCRCRPNDHQATVSESAPVKLGMLCSKALDHKFEFGQVKIATHFTHCTTALRPTFGRFIASSYFLGFFFKANDNRFLRKNDFKIPNHHIFSVSRIPYYHPHMFYS